LKRFIWVLVAVAALAVLYLIVTVPVGSVDTPI
jgi:hypothetical protein